MWQIIKNLENLIYIIITTVNYVICPSVLIMMHMSRGMKWMLTDSEAAQSDQMVTSGELWRQHRTQAPEVTAQWRANRFSYRINRSARQSQAKLMTRVFSCWSSCWTTGRSSQKQQRRSWRRLLKLVFLRIPQSSHKLLHLPRNQKQTLLKLSQLYLYIESKRRSLTLHKPRSN